MPTKTESDPVTLGQLLQPRPVSVDLDSHKADMARRQAEHDAKREELRKCLNPKYAAKREAEKPHYRYTVAATYDYQGETRPHTSEQVVVAQDENDAWAMFCDKIGEWPSRKYAKVTFTQGRQVTVSEIVTPYEDEDDGEDRTPVVIGPKARPKNRL